MIRRISLVVLAIVVVTLRLTATASAEPLQFNRDVRPILAEHCFACHGPDSASRKADLRLDKREVAVDSGAIVPGEPKDSELVARIFTEDAKSIMPPPEVKKELNAAQKETLKRWVAEGAEYQPHWALIAPKRPEPPKVKNAKWVRTPIDAFVLAALEQKGLEPAPEADRRTLARRLSLDLTGLPPKPEMVEAFVNDKSAKAYEKLVDKLLASKHYGEHRGRYWLDAARYADTHGIHFDNFREMWTYRDWVINAFNANMPFDQFTVEQLAGDLLPNRTPEQQIASGFNRCNMTTSEGGIIDEEYLVLYARDRTETTSTVWMGLTTGCAVCHDHKFDPISQREFYELAAFFNNTTQAAKDGNAKDTPPILVVPQSKDRRRWTMLSTKVAEDKERLEERAEAARAKFDKWLPKASREAFVGAGPVDGLQLHVPLDEAEGASVRAEVLGEKRQLALEKPLLADVGYVWPKAFKTQVKCVPTVADAGDFDADQPFSVSVWVKLPDAKSTGAIVARMGPSPEYRGWDLYVDNGRLAVHHIHKFPEESTKVVARKAIGTGWKHVTVTYDGSRMSDGIKMYINGELQAITGQTNFAMPLSIRTDAPFTIGQRSGGNGLKDALIQDVRVYDRQLGVDDIELLNSTPRAERVIDKVAANRTEAEQKLLYRWWLLALDDVYARLSKVYRTHERDRDVIKSRGTIAHVMEERTGDPMAYILFRGEYDQRRDEVPAKTPEALPPMPDDLPDNRLGLAQWLLREEHPLTTRVTVNRFWQELFGTGLVRTSGDFGVSGELPSHPELLDWMAVEFRESDWDIKRFFKMLVTSAAYRQAAITTPEKLAADPSNRLLSRGPRFRMDAEMVRDYALAASGMLVETIGGKSVRPYQPDGVWEAVAMTASNTRFYQRDSGDGLYRRSMYTFWKRAAPPASMDIFNAPNREVCTVRRDRTNTPLQALVTLNDPQFVEAARHLAEATLAGSRSASERMDSMSRHLLCRPLRPEEALVANTTLLDFMSHYQSHPDEAKQLVHFGEKPVDEAINTSELAAWTMLANTLMNLDEVLNK